MNLSAVVGRACDRFLVERVPGYRVLSFQGADVTERMLGGTSNIEPLTSNIEPNTSNEC